MLKQFLKALYLILYSEYQPGQAKRRARVKALCMFVCAANHHIYIYAILQRGDNVRGLVYTLTSPQ